MTQASQQLSLRHIEMCIRDSVSAMTMVQMSRLSSDFNQSSQVSGEHQSLVRSMIMAIYRMRLAVTKYVSYQRPADLDDYNKAVSELKNLLDVASRTLVETEQRSGLDKLGNSFKDYQAVFEKVIRLLGSRQKTLTEVMGVQGPLAEQKLGELFKQAVQAKQSGAVSYTHLDVYKRQIFSGTPSRSTFYGNRYCPI